MKKMPAIFVGHGSPMIALDHNELTETYRRLGERILAEFGKPKAILAHTVKGKGVSFMENQVGWHGKAPNEEQRQQALKELED